MNFPSEAQSTMMRVFIAIIVIGGVIIVYLLARTYFPSPAAISLVPGTIDNGQAATIGLSWSGGAPPYTLTLYSSSSPSCTLSSSFVAQKINQPSAQYSFSVSPTTTAYYCGIVQSPTGSSGVSPSTELVVAGSLGSARIGISPSTMDTGQSLFATATVIWQGGTSPFTVTLFSGSSATCSSDKTLVSVSVGSNPRTGVLSMSNDFTFAAPTATTYYCATVSNSAAPSTYSTSPTTKFTVYSALSAGISPSPPSIDSGQPVKMTATTSHGSPPYSYQWYTGTSCSSGSMISKATSQAYTSSPLTSATGYSVLVTDASKGTPLASACVHTTVRVNPAFTGSGVSISPSNRTVDSGQSTTLVVSWTSAGTPPYDVQLETSPSSDCQSPVAFGLPENSLTNHSTTFTISPTSSSYFCASVRDSAVASEGAATVVAAFLNVNSALTSGLTLSSSAIDIGHYVTETATAAWSGGTGPFSVTLYSSPTSDCLSNPTAVAVLLGANPQTGLTGSSTSFSFSSPSSTTYYCAVVVDSAAPPDISNSSAIQLSVNPALSASISPPAPRLDSGQSVAMTAVPVGGTPPYNFQWYMGSTCSAYISGQTSSTYSSGALTASQPYSVLVTDSSGGTSPVSVCVINTVSVSASISVQLDLSLTQIDVGQAATPSATVSWSGGSPPYSVALFKGASSTCSADTTQVGKRINGATATSESFSFAAPGATTYYCADVTDSATSPATVSSSAVRLSVNPPLDVPTLTLSAKAIDSGQTITMRASVVFSGGTPSYIVTLQSGSNVSCSRDTMVVPVTYGSNPIRGTAQTTASFTFDSPSSTTRYCVTVTDSSTDPVTVRSATANFTVNRPLSVTLDSFKILVLDEGQAPPINITARWVGGTPPFTVTLFSGASSLCTYDSTSAFVSPGSNPLTGLTGTTANFTSVYPSSTSYYCAEVTDSAPAPVSVYSPARMITVNPALSSSIEASRTAIDSGQNSTLSTDQFSGGTPPLTCQWLEESPGESAFSSLGASFSCVTSSYPSVSTGILSTPGTWYFELQTNDTSSAPVSFNSLPVAVTVRADPKVTLSSLSPSAIDSGQTTTVVARVTWTGGTSPFTVTLYGGASSACSSDTVEVATSGSNPQLGLSGSSATFTFVPPASKTYYCATLKDSATDPITNKTSTVLFTINPALTATISPGASKIDAGQSVTLKANPLQGTPPYFYQWYTGASCTNAIAGKTSQSYVSSPASTASYSVLVTDSSPGTPAASACAPVTVTVNSALTATVSPVSPAIDTGQSITLTANPSQGTSPYTYQWYTGGSCGSAISGATSQTYSPSPTSTTSYSVKVADSSVGTPAASACAPVTVTVNPALSTPALSLSPSSIDSGQTVSISAKVTWSGGTSSYTVTLYSGSSSTCSSDTTVVGSQVGVVGRSATFSTGSLGSTTYYCATVTDSATPPQTGKTSAAPFTVNSALTATVTPVSPAIDTGQSITLTANPSQGTSPYTYQWYTGGSCGSAISGATSQTYSPSPTSTTSYSVKVADSSVGTPAASACAPVTVTVNSALTATVSPVSPTIDNGQSITLTANPSQGTSPYTYQWYSGASCVSPISGKTSQAYSPSPASTTSYSVKVTDSSPGAPESYCAGATVTVNPALTVTISPGAPAIDSGQSITLKANPLQGTPPYSYQWYTGASCTSPISGATSQSYVPSPPSSTSYYAKVTDSSSSAPASSCAGATVTVNPALTVTISPGAPAIDSGQSVMLTASPLHGTLPYAYQWYNGPSCGSAISGATSQSYSTGALTSATTYSVLVTDSSSSAPVSSCVGVSVTVNPAPTATISPASPTINNGQSITLTANPSQGTPPYSYQWYTGSSCGSAIVGKTAQTYVPSPASTASYSVLVTDSSIGTPAAIASACAPVTVMVNPALTASISPASPAIDNGQSITLTANPSQGTSPYSYQWYTGGSCGSAISGATSQTYAPSPSSTTSYSVKVTDSSGGTPAAGACAPVTVTVNPALTAPVISASPTTVSSGGSSTLSTTTSFSGGTPSYTCQWLVEAPGSGSYSDLGSSFSCTTSSLPTTSTGPLTTGIWSFELEVTDSSAVPAAPAISNTVTVTAS
jgi:hypothetical protein